jgi:peptide/nickel transport system permease protein
VASYIIKRLLQLIPLLFALSIIIFIIIELPPGDFLTSRIAELEQAGTKVGQEEIARLQAQYGLDKPLIQRYFKWVWNIIRYGNLGLSFQFMKPVRELLGERIVLTVVISIITIIFTYAIAIPIGIYSATHQYSMSDYLVSFLGFIGLSVPGFLLALILIYIAFAHLGINVTGLFSPRYVDAKWSIARVYDMLKRVWIPVIVVGLSGTASTIRIMRACLLDELRKQYVVTARAKGLSERRILLKYPVRVALNPIISTIGWLLPYVVSSSTLVDIVLNLPTTGPLLMKALLYQDMYLAGSFLMVLSFLTAIGTMLSDILLAWLDPRIRFGGVGE